MMKMKNNPFQFDHNLSRRQTLRGLSLGVSATLLGPLISQCRAEADGKSDAIPKRVVFVVQSNGLAPKRIVPEGIEFKEHGGRTHAEQLNETSIVDKQLPEALSTLEPFRKRMTLLQGLSGRVAVSDHSCNHGALGCYSARGVHGQTIDSVLGQALPAVFPHVLLGLGSDGKESLNYAHSALARDTPLPAVCSPDLAFRSLFGSAEVSGTAAFNRKSHLLDFMGDDVRRTRSALPASERHKVDSYADAFESLHRRQNAIGAMSDAIRRHTPDLGDRRYSTTSSEVLKAQFEIAGAALIAGLTNVVTITSGSGRQRFGKFPELGLPDLHSLGHGKQHNGKTKEENCIMIHQLHTRQVAKLAAKLDAVKEGDGTMLDNTLIVFMSDSGDDHHPRLYNWPMVLIGNLGGRLKTDGRYLEFPGYGKTNHSTIASLYTTLLHAAGAPRDSFGQDDISLSGTEQGAPLQTLLT